MTIKYTTILFALLGSTLIAQDYPTDKEMIKTAVENYFNGYIQRDSVQLYTAFDTKNGTMKVPAKTKEGMDVYDNIFFRELIPKWANREKLPPEILSNCELEILNIDVVNNQMGTAKIRMKVDKTTYIDLLSLQKTNEEWKITNKMYIVLND